MGPILSDHFFMSFSFSLCLSPSLLLSLPPLISNPLLSASHGIFYFTSSAPLTQQGFCVFVFNFQIEITEKGHIF